MFNNELFLLKYGKYMKQLLSIKEKALKNRYICAWEHHRQNKQFPAVTRDCNCGELACSAVWGRDLFPGICGEFADGAIQEEASFPWHFWISGSIVWGKASFS